MHPGVYILTYRKQKGISRVKMAELMGVNYLRLQKWESEVAQPTYTDLTKILAFFRKNNVQDLTEQSLRQAVAAEIDEDEGVLNMVADGGDYKAQLAAKDQRIKELEKMVQQLQEVVELLKEQLKKG